VKSELVVINFEKLQSEWDQTAKGKFTNDYLPRAAEKLNMKINLTQNFTLLRGMGTKAYLHRFKIIETPSCLCGYKDQSIDQLVFQFEILKKESQINISSIKVRWLANKQIYTNKEILQNIC